MVFPWKRKTDEDDQVDVWCFPERKTEMRMIRGQDYKRFSSMSRCSTHNLCSEMT